jgi:hypothetical protein
MIVEIPVPLDGGELSCQVFGDKIFDSHQWGVRISRLKQEALKNLVGNSLAVMMERAARRAVRHHMRSLHMDLVSDGRACGFTAHGF